MSRRYVSLWLPTWPIDRFRLQARRAGEPDHKGAPLALLHLEAGGPRLYATAAEAIAWKLKPGLALADARAICPTLIVADADPARDALALEALALWCGRYSPWVATDGSDGVILDITGCAHLWRGEARLLQDLEARLAPLGFKVHTASADNPAAAWAWARFGDGGPLAGTAMIGALLQLPIAALRLPTELVQALQRLGFKRVGDLETVPHAPLIARFGALPVERLHLLLGRTREPFTPLSAPARHAVRLAWAEPLGTTEGLTMALTEAMANLCQRLEEAQQGARRLGLELARLDGAVHRCEARTARANRDSKALQRLFKDQLDGLDLGFGIEVLRLAATETEPLTARQLTAGGGEDGEAAAAAQLIDRLSQRLGADRVRRLQPVDSHWPERACAEPAALDAGASSCPWPARGPRPLRLLTTPRPVTAIAEVPDGPPRRLRLDGGIKAVRAVAGPERIEPEWWRDEAAMTRDYYRLELEDGRRLWVRREGRYDDDTPPHWSLDGVFV